MATITTLAPSWAALKAIFLPIPLEAPVITMVLPLRKGFWQGKNPVSDSVSVNIDRAFDQSLQGSSDLNRRMYACKWGDCHQGFTKYDAFEDHVLTHIIEEIPTTVNNSSLSSGRTLPSPDDTGKEPATHEDEEAEEDDIICVLCEDGSEKPNNQIVICDGCDRGYHQNCHPTVIPDYQLQQENIEWLCYNCAPASSSSSKRLRALEA